MTRLRSAYEALKTALFWAVVVTLPTGLIDQFIRQNFAINQWEFWRMVTICYGMAMIVATVCAIYIERHEQ